MNNKVVALGGLCVDLISYGERFPKPGETLFGHSFDIGCGGKAGNGCVGAARLGVPTSMIGKVGNDQFGDLYIKTLKENNVNIDQVVVANSTTSTANIFVSDSGQNCIMYVNGHSVELTDNDVIKAANEIVNSKIFYCTFECSADATIQALKIAHKASVTTVVNAAPYSECFGSEVFKLCDILCVNETEAGLFCNTSVKTISDAKLAIETLIDKGCKVVIVTMGELGAVGGSTDGDFFHVISPKVKAIDTTGAGDSFMAALVCYLSSYPSLTLTEKVKRSCEIASISVQKKGTQKSYPFRKDLPDHLFSI